MQRVIQDADLATDHVEILFPQQSQLLLESLRVGKIIRNEIRKITIPPAISSSGP